MRPKEPRRQRCFPSKTGLSVRGLTFDTVQYRSAILEPWPPKNIFSLARWYLFERTRDVFVPLWKDLSHPNTKCVYNDGERLLSFLRTMCAKPYDQGGSKFTPGEALFGLSLCKLSSCFTRVNLTTLKADTQSGDTRAFMSQAKIWYPHRRFIITNRGYYGPSPEVTKEGDVRWVLNRMSAPVILRKEKQVGEAFILGLMEGQAIENMDKWGLKEQDFTLC